MKVIFSNRAYAAVLAETAEKIGTETGGLFLGVAENDTWYVVEAIDPGPKSVFEIAYFEYDKHYTEHLINKVANLYSAKLDLIGLWHRHPGSFDQFSSTDDKTNAKYAAMRKEGAISALVNVDPDFRITMYHVEQPYKYRKIRYEIGDELIPGELLSYKTPERFFKIMEYRLEKERGSTPERPFFVSLETFMKVVLPYAEEYVGTVAVSDTVPAADSADELAASVIDDLEFMTGKAFVNACAAASASRLEISDRMKPDGEKLIFTYNPDDGKTVFSYHGKEYNYESGFFESAVSKAANTEAEPSGKPRGIIGSVKKVFKKLKDEEQTWK